MLCTQILAMLHLFVDTAVFGWNAFDIVIASLDIRFWLICFAGSGILSTCFGRVLFYSCSWRTWHNLWYKCLNHSSKTDSSNAEISVMHCWTNRDPTFGEGAQMSWIQGCPSPSKFAELKRNLWEGTLRCWIVTIQWEIWTTYEERRCHYAAPKMSVYLWWFHVWVRWNIRYSFALTCLDNRPKRIVTTGAREV